MPRTIMIPLTTGLNARKLSIILMQLDKEVFGHRLFKITDSIAFNGFPKAPEYVELEKDTAAVGHKLVLIATGTICYTLQWEGEDGQLHGCPPGSNYIDCMGGGGSQVICDDFELWGDDGDLGGGNPPQPSGGGSGGNSNPCRIIPTIGGSGNCGSGGPTGWVPVVDENDHQPYSPYVYDSIGISNEILDSFPCLYAFLNDSLPNINFLAQLAGARVFKDSAYMHLTFDTSTIYTQPGQPSGETEIAILPFVDDNGITTFSALIHFNSWYLRNGTKEYMISTIVHEAMHAIFNLRWGQYIRWRDFGQGTIDSNWMKAHYPSQWYYTTGQTRPLSELQDHEIMAADYINKYKSIMQQFWNPSANIILRDSVLNAMAYGGLTATTVWKALSSHGIDTCKYKAIQLSSERSLTNSFGVPGCGTYNYHYADSLKLRSGCN